MIERVGVEGQPSRTACKSPFDGPVEQPRAYAPADIGKRESEECQVVAGELDVARQVAVVPRDMQFMAGLVQQSLQGSIRQKPTLVPQPWPADAVVELAVEGGG